MRPKLIIVGGRDRLLRTGRVSPNLPKLPASQEAAVRKRLALFPLLIAPATQQSRVSTLHPGYTVRAVAIERRMPEFVRLFVRADDLQGPRVRALVRRVACGQVRS